MLLYKFVAGTPGALLYPKQKGRLSVEQSDGAVPQHSAETRPCCSAPHHGGLEPVETEDTALDKEGFGGLGDDQWKITRV